MTTHARTTRPSLYEHAGSEEAIHRLEAIFYAKVPADPPLEPLFGSGHPGARESSDGVRGRVLRRTGPVLARLGLRPSPRRPPASGHQGGAPPTVRRSQH